MKEANRARLLKIARDSVSAAIMGSAMPELNETDPELTGKQGCFVTLKNGEMLRGCLGNFISEMPLCRMVSEMAHASATEDPRFFSSPITPDELNDLAIEISVLSPLERIRNPLDLKLGVHGIYIRRGGASGCFLPQVATETGWSKEEFLGYCCSHKAGLSRDAWQDPKTEVYVFTAEIINERE